MPSKSDLKKKVSRFIKKHYRGSIDCRDFLENACQYGQVAVVGGVLRDLYLYGDKEFNSDVDFVISSTDPEGFRSFLQGRDANRNRFGGYELTTGRWKTDIWFLEETWVHTEGYRTINTFEDLLESTFFNWDAIYFDYKKKRIACSKNYFKNIEARLLDINCVHNPNPIGNALRALIAIKKHDAVLAPALVGFVVNTLNPRTLLNKRYYVKEKIVPHYQIEDIISILRELNRHHKTEPATPFKYSFNKIEQLALQFSEPTRPSYIA